MNAASVAIVLVNWNSWREVIECLDSLLAQSYPNYHVFVVDNDSRDESIEHIRTWCGMPQAHEGWRALDGVSRITAGAGLIEPVEVRSVEQPEQNLPAPRPDCCLTLIRSGANLGFAGGCNVGIRAAGVDAFDFFWLLNPDTVVQRDALQALIRRAQADTGLGMIGSTVRYYGRPDLVQALGGSLMEPETLTTRHIGTGERVTAVSIAPSEVERRLFYVMGASMLVPRRLIQEIGLMQEDYFLYYEEIDWAMRARPRFTLGYAPDSHIFHKSGASTKSSPFSTRLYYRNRIRFVSRFFPGRLGTVRRGLFIELLRHTLSGRWSHVRIVADILWRSNAIAAQVSTQPAGLHPTISRS